MTAKRFILTENGYVYDTIDKAICPSAESVIKLLNDLNMENDKFKQELKTRSIINRQYEGYQELKEDNRRLRLENGQLTHDLYWANETIKEYEDLQKMNNILIEEIQWNKSKRKELLEKLDTIQETLSNYWKKDNGYLTSKEVISLIMKELEMELLL